MSQIVGETEEEPSAFPYSPMSWVGKPQKLSEIRRITSKDRSKDNERTMALLLHMLLTVVHAVHLITFSYVKHVCLKTYFPRYCLICPRYPTIGLPFDRFPFPIPASSAPAPWDEA